MSTERLPHPYAEIFPLLPDEELKTLSEDIKVNGLKDTIVIFEEKILDGRNRYAACKIADVTPRLQVFTGSDEEALQLVTSRNLHRRHLTASQRAMIAAKLASMVTHQQPESDEDTTDQSTEKQPYKPTQKPAKKMAKKQTIKTAAKTMNVSPASVKKAKAVAKQSPEKAKQVETGEKSLDQAHQEMQQETGQKNERDIATKLGNSAIASLGRISKEFRKDIFERVKIWIDANIDL